MTNDLLSISGWPPLRADWRTCALWLWIAAMAAVTTLSLLPEVAPPGEYGLDKLIHALSYLALALLPHAAFDGRRTALTAALAMIALGCAIEVAQGFVPARFGDVWDAVANSAGALTGVALGARFRRIVCAATRGAR